MFYLTGRKEIFYLTGWKEGNVLFNGKEGNVLYNDTLNTFYFRLYGIRHKVKDRSDGLLFPISIKDYFICTNPQTG